MHQLHTLFAASTALSKCPCIFLLKCTYAVDTLSQIQVDLVLDLLLTPESYKGNSSKLITIE